MLGLDVRLQGGPVRGTVGTHLALNFDAFVLHLDVLVKRGP